MKGLPIFSGSGVLNILNLMFLYSYNSIFQSRSAAVFCSGSGVLNICRGVGAILNKNTNIRMALIIYCEIRYTFGVITYNFYLFTVLPTKISSKIIYLNTNGVFRLCSK